MESYTSKLMNIVWRKVRESIDEKVKDLASKFGYLDYMVARYYEMLGSWDEVIDLLESFEKPLAKSIRINTLRFENVNEVIEGLKELGYELSKILWESTSYTISRVGRVPPGATHGFLLGGYYLYRGVGSLIPPLALSPSKWDRVLDGAAAPGGKTTHISQLMDNLGLVVAVDISRQRFRALRSNIERMGVENVVAIRTDVRRVPDIFGSYFTKSLLDAPCTGEGIIQLDPLRKTKTSFEDLVEAHRRQVELLKAVIRSTAPGGRILYSTCSIAPEEDEFTIAEVIESVDGVEVIRPELGLNLNPGITEYFGVELPDRVKYCGRIYPHRHEMEGYFICLLRKSQ